MTGTHAISSMSGALRVKVFMMGGPMSVCRFLLSLVAISPYLRSWEMNRGEECRQARGELEETVDERRTTGRGDVRDEEEGEWTEESRQSSSTGRSQGLDDRLGIRGGDGGGGGPAGERQGEQGGLQFHVPIQSVPFPHGMVSPSRDDCRLRSSLVVLGERWARGRAGEPMAVHAAEVWRRSGTRWSSPRIQEKPSPVSRHPAIQQ